MRMELCELVHFVRKKSGLSRNALAELAAVGKTVIYDLEHGKKTVRLDTLEKICKALNITIEYQHPLVLGRGQGEGGHEKG